MIAATKQMAAAIVALLVSTAALAQDYPSKPVTIVVPSAAGGTTDFTARLLSEGLSKALGQQFVVENKGGASGNLGTLSVARASPDGYTLLLAYSGYHVANPALFPQLNWHPLDSFTPVALALKAPHVVIVKKALPVSTLKDFVAYAKANSGSVNYASSGRGSIQHIGAELLGQVAGIKMSHVPYRGAGPAMNDIVGGQVDLFITTPPSAVGHIQSGSVKALALASRTRHPLMPDIPTTGEAGVNGIELDAWFALFAPAKTPQPIIDKLTMAVEAIVASGDFRRRAEQAGTNPEFMDGPRLAEFTRRELSYWSTVISKSAITGE